MTIRSQEKYLRPLKVQADIASARRYHAEQLAMAIEAGDDKLEAAEHAEVMTFREFGMQPNEYLDLPDLGLDLTPVQAKPAVDQPFRVVAHFATGEGIEKHSTSHTRYSDAAARFWQTVQLMRDDGKDVPTFPGGMRREAEDRVHGGMWSVELEVVR